MQRKFDKSDAQPHDAVVKVPHRLVVVFLLSQSRPLVQGNAFVLFIFLVLFVLFAHCHLLAYPHTTFVHLGFAHLVRHSFEVASNAFLGKPRKLRVVISFVHAKRGRMSAVLSFNSFPFLFFPHPLDLLLALLQPQLVPRGHIVNAVRHLFQRFLGQTRPEGWSLFHHLLSHSLQPSWLTQLLNPVPVRSSLVPLHLVRPFLLFLLGSRQTLHHVLATLCHLRRFL